MLFRQDWLLQSGGFARRLLMSEETKLVLWLARSRCEAEWLWQVTVSYRQREDNATHKELLQAESLSAILAEFFSQGELPESIRLLENSVCYNMLVWLA